MNILFGIDIERMEIMQNHGISVKVRPNNV